MVDSNLGGKFWNQVFKEGKQDYQDLYASVKADLLVDGFPAFHVPLSPAERFQRLVALQRSGDPSFENDPKAQAELVRLGRQFAPQPAALPGGTYPAEPTVTYPNTIPLARLSQA